MKIVIALTGMPASGKTTVAKHLQAKGACWIHLGDYIWNYLKKKGVPLKQENEIKAGLFIHTHYKDVPIMRWGLKKIKECDKKVCVLDSLRSVEEHLFFKNHFKRYCLVAVLADEKERFRRERVRARFGEKVTLNSFKKRDYGEKRLGVGALIKIADHYIDANKSIRSIKLQATNILHHCLTAAQ